MDGSELFRDFFVEEIQDAPDWLESHIKKSIPSLSPAIVNKVISLLMSIGVETKDDLKLVSENDIDKSLLKPIQFRKLVNFSESNKETCNQTVLGTEKEEEHPLKDNVSSSTDKHDWTGHKTAVVHSNWLQTFTIEVDFFRKSIKDLLLAGKKLPDKQRHEVKLASYNPSEDWEPCGQMTVFTVLSCIMISFKEKMEDLFPCVEEGTCVKEITKKLPSHPCLIVAGNDCRTARRFMLSVDGIIVNDHIQNLFEGVTAVFALYFIVNVVYPDSCQCTLQFLERFAAKITPDEKKKSLLNPKVLTFLNKVSNYEWSNE